MQRAPSQPRPGASHSGHVRSFRLLPASRRHPVVVPQDGAAAQRRAYLDPDADAERHCRSSASIPEPRIIGKRAIAWLGSEVAQWMGVR